MPWRIVRGGKDCPFEVVRSDTGDHVACHPTRMQAENHMAALYANEPSAGKANTMDVVTKATAAVAPVESENPNGEFDVILSTDALDRDGEMLHADEWKTPLPDHIMFDSDHGMSVEKTVGSGKPFINDAGQLQVRGTYASTPHAQAVRTLVNEGHITKTSVAFMSAKTKKDAKPQRELLNGSFVAVPANPEAVVLSSKAADLEDAADTEEPGEATEPDPQDMMQAIHDAAVHLGAVCGAQGKSLYQIPASAVHLITKTTSTASAGTPHDSPDSEPADTADAADPVSPAEPVEAADLSADVAALHVRGLTARAQAFLQSTDNQERS